MVEGLVFITYLCQYFCLDESASDGCMCFLLCMKL